MDFWLMHNPIVTRRNALLNCIRFNPPSGRIKNNVYSVWKYM